MMQKLFLQQDCTKLAVVGLGGIGKTQVALKFAYNVKDTQPDCSIFWVSAMSAGTIEQAYQDIAVRCSIEKSAEEADLKDSVRRYLSSEASGKWLIIVDNADNEGFVSGQPGQPEESIKNYLPQNSGLVLFTTRHLKAATALARNNVINLQQMPPLEAQMFLRVSLIEESLLSDTASVDKLLEELTYLPLAIAQAATYLNANPHFLVSEYVSLLQGAEKEAISLLRQEFDDDTRHMDWSNAVATTWLVSMNRLEEYDANAANLLAIVSTLETKAIPRSIFPPLQVEASNESTERAIGTLCSYAFMSRQGNSDLYNIHRLVHLGAR